MQEAFLRLFGKIAGDLQKDLRIQWNAIIAKSLDDTQLLAKLAHPAGLGCVTQSTSDTQSL
jgi:hypothetical protein